MEGTDMKIHTIWGQRIDDGSIPELIDSWDEYTIEENEDGYHDAVSAAKARKEFIEVRVVILNVPSKAVLDTFKVPAVDAKVEG
jgi:hypothetical protein